MELFNNIDSNIMLVGLVLVIIISFFLFINFFAQKMDKKIPNNAEHGSARFATKQELHHGNKKEGISAFKKEKLGDIKEFGFPIWFDYKYKLKFTPISFTPKHFNLLPIKISKQLDSMLVDRTTPHWLFLGSTGSGKSLTAVMPQAGMIANAKVKRSIFFTDPKGELFTKTSQMVKDNGYEVLTLDFRNPIESNKLNLLEDIIKQWEIYFNNKHESARLEEQIKTLSEDLKKVKDNYVSIKDDNKKKDFEDKITSIEDEIIISEDERINIENTSLKAYGEAGRLVLSLASAVTSEKVTPDKFWTESAGNLLTGLIYYFLELYEQDQIKRNQLTLSSISIFQGTLMDTVTLNNFKKLLKKIDPNADSRKSITASINAPEQTYQSIASTLGNKLKVFNDLEVKNVTSVSDMDFDVLGKGIESIDENGNKIIKPVALYCIIPDEHPQYNVLITLIVSMMYKSLVKLAVSTEKGEVPIKIVFLLDEFANSPAFPDIASMVTVARSRGIQFQFYVQDYSQLDSVYGAEVAQTIKSNAGLVYLKTQDYKTADILSKLLGNKTISSQSFSKSLKLFDTNGGSKNTSLMARPLLTADEIMQLHYKTIIWPVEGHPIFRKTVPFFDFERDYKKNFYYGKIERSQTPLSKLEENTYILSIPSPGSTPPPLTSSKLEDLARRNAVENMYYNDVEYLNNQKNLLSIAVSKIKEIIPTNFGTVSYSTKRGHVSALIKTKRLLTSKDESIIQKINDNQTKVAYIIETAPNKDFSLISIYIKNQIQAHINSIDPLTLPVEEPQYD